MDLKIKNRHALLTGASKGLGRACAERFAEAGARVTLVARDERALRATCDEIGTRYNVRADWIVADTAKPEDRAAVLAKCPDPDILVLSSGWPKGAMQATPWDPAAWQGALESMLLGQAQMLSTVGEGMARRGFGRMVVVTSRLIKEPEFELALPAAARMGLSAYIKALSNHLARHNVTVNSILPGIFDTETQKANTARLVAEQGLTEAEVVAKRAVFTPAGRFGTPEEFSALCAYLCSADAGFMTGQALTLDGGAHSGVL
ncbi:SDR family oxidoreductase [Ramlibacter sp.]|uniref:SDR family oxidoreductase n=1 Tax=Ramlibacter sp. TaxID=1917967 RepID=UPI003D0E99D7